MEAAVLFYLTNFVALPQVTDKPILIYPNSGERYDGEKKGVGGKFIEQT